MSDSLIFQLLVLVPLAPLAAACILALSPPGRRRWAATVAVGALAISLVAALVLLGVVLGFPGAEGAVLRRTFSFPWLTFGDTPLVLGVLLDPLTAAMLAMVAMVGLIIFIFSLSYMAHDERFSRFFGFLSLFAAAMLGLVVSNSLLLLFICWELVGLASYLLIGFWYQKPSAVAACQKAFLVTRVADLGLFLGMIWLHAETGTLLFYDGGGGLLEGASLGRLATAAAVGGFALPTVLALLVFFGACGKSGQFPLHVWLPDAMEGPTPVSALIHAATMVTAGVFLVARMFPLFEGGGAGGTSVALAVVAWTGAFTAVFAACVAVAQNDIKRILAYSTISQLGFMMLCLGVGGMAAAMFHLIAHAFFKALLFLGAGSIIHGCGDEQDIRSMGGLGRRMPVTFATYAVGMMALAGFPFFFSGFWSKEEILHLAHAWPVSQGPFMLALMGTFLTAFYMSRQMLLVFFGQSRSDAAAKAHESPVLMLLPLVMLALGAILFGVLATPAWRAFDVFLEGGQAEADFTKLFDPGTLGLMALSIVLVAVGVASAWVLYGKSDRSASSPDPMERLCGPVFRALAAQLHIDGFYAATLLRARDAAGWAANFLDRFVWGGMVAALAGLCRLGAFCGEAIDRFGFNGGFDLSCLGLKRLGVRIEHAHGGSLQSSLAWIGVGLILLVLIFAWT